MSVIANLDDGCFVLATECLVAICKKVEQAAGQKPTLADLCELLTWGLRSTSADILADANTCNVSLEGSVSKKGKVVLQPGDVVGIPSGTLGMCFLAVYIANNVFGHAFAVMQGKQSLRPPFPERRVEFMPRIFYTGNRSVASGRWPVVAHCPWLLEGLPRSPEIYHPKRLRMDDDRIGPYGSAESPDGTLRTLSEEEAERVGLLSKQFRQGYSEEALEALLAEQDP